MYQIIDIQLRMNYTQNTKKLKYQLENTWFYLHSEINLKGEIQWFVFSLMSVDGGRGVYQIFWCYGSGIYWRSFMGNGPSVVGSIIIYIICSGQQVMIKYPISLGEIVYFTFNIYMWSLTGLLKLILKKIGSPLCERVGLKTHWVAQMLVTEGLIGPFLGSLFFPISALYRRDLIHLIHTIKSSPHLSSTLQTL